MIPVNKKTIFLLFFSFFMFACGRHHGGAGSAAFPAPAGVVATSLDGEVRLSWDPVTGATGYNVYVAATSGVTKANYSLLAEGKKHTGVPNPFDNTGLSNGVTYYFVVTALNNAGESVESVEVSATPTGAISPPPAPTGIRVTPADGQATLEWSSAQGATSYFIYMAKVSGINRNNWNAIVGGKRTQVLGGATIYIQTGLTNGTTYYFVVTAANSLGQSAESSEVSTTPFLATAIPARPQNLSASAGDQKVTLSWDNAPGATSYTLYWKAAPGVTPSNGQPIPNVSSPYVQTGLTNGSPYYYVVAGKNDLGEGLPSLEATATPTPTPPPAVVTLAATNITISGAATLNGSVNPNGFGATAYFEWGVTTAYGNTTGPQSIPAGGGFVSINANLSGLAGNTPYHYRAVATSSNGTSVGADQSFVLPFLGAPHEYSVGVATSPNDVVVADFNGDGKLDFATANYGTNDVSVLIQAADGTFGPAIRYPVGSHPQHLAVGDFDGNGKADLIVSNSNDGTVSLLLNNGSGFSAATSFHLWGNLANSGKTFPAGLVVGDLNKDANLDVAVAVIENGVGNVAVLLGDGVGGFSGPTLFPVGASPSGIVAGNFDNDVSANLDLVVTNLSPTTDPVTGQVTNRFSLLSGSGNGSFGAPTFYDLPDSRNEPYVAVAQADFDVDGKPDLVIANNKISTVSILINNGPGIFGTPTDMTVGLEPFAVSVGDFNSDGKPDLIVPNFRDNSVTIYLGIGGSGFGPSFVSPVGLNPIAVASGDFNGDGKLDLAVANVSGNSVTILLGQ